MRRRLLSNDKYLSGIESGTAVFKGSGRLGGTSYSLGVGRETRRGGRRVSRSDREGW
ncbi:hypothetical protein ACWDFR_17010 [Streptomyces sp. 900105755]|uniref:hypothetical protein n=1 Tax=Streptomyces sp. NPDC001507 TaxID=3364579 RepID=UPI0036AEE45F